MAVLKIVTDPDPVLREVARPVGAVTAEISGLANDMVDTMRAAEGLGLAAPQVGRSLRMFVLDANGAGIVFIDPDIIRAEGCAAHEEGCLSIPGVTRLVTRAERVIVEASGISGARFQMECKGIFAAAVQHEIDHLDGVLMTDAHMHADPCLTPEQEAELERRREGPFISHEEMGRRIGHKDDH